MKITETAAKYPGDSIMTLRLILRHLPHGDELGSIRVQDYGQGMRERYKVGAFLPGVVQDLPGDSPKVWPEHEQWTNDLSLARCFFYLMAGKALVDGWDLTP